jgi:hypothetical protein
MKAQDVERISGTGCEVVVVGFCDAVTNLPVP